jgi:hypothetical protein
MVSRDAVEISNTVLSVLGGLIQFPSESGCLNLDCARCHDLEKESSTCAGVFGGWAG